ncbi:MAG: Fur family transcriptional regulator [Thermodesulfobacteriota bacterium]
MKKEENTYYQQLTRFEEECDHAGLKVTQQRLEIFRELALADDHPTAEALHTRLLERLPTLSLDTVYRTLATFEKHTLVTRVQTPESQARFELRLGEKRHHHLICRNCGRITDFVWSSFDAAPPPETVADWGSIESQSATLFGVCRKCQGR